MEKFKFKIHKGGYDSVIIFDLEVLKMDQDNINDLLLNDLTILKIEDYIYLRCRDHDITREATCYLANGLSHVKNKIKQSLNDDVVLIDIYKMTTLIVDYQESLWELAIVQWASGYFKFEMPQVDINVNLPNEGERFRFRWID